MDIAFWILYFITLYFVISLGISLFIQSKVVHIWKFWELERKIHLASLLISLSITAAMAYINNGVFQ